MQYSTGRFTAEDAEDTEVAGEHEYRLPECGACATLACNTCRVVVGAQAGEGRRMGKRRLRGLVIVGVLLCLLGLATIWFMGGWPTMNNTGQVMEHRWTHDQIRSG